MANKVPWYVTFNWKNISGFIAIAATLGFIVVVIILPNLIHDNKLNKYKGETTGTLTNITENTRFSQSLEGNKIYISSYTVYYYYQVAGRTYNSSEQLKASQKAKSILEKINQSEHRQLVIRYDLDEPQRSTILLTPEQKAAL